MDENLFSGYKKVFWQIGSTYAEKHKGQFDSTLIDLNSYDDLKSHYKEKDFFDKNEYIDLSAVLAVFTLAFLPRGIITFDIINPNLAQRTAKESILSTGSIFILKAGLIKRLIGKFPNQKEYIKSFEFKYEYIGNAVKYLHSLVLRTSKNRYMENCQYVFPLSQIYRAIILNMELDFLNKLMIDYPSKIKK